MTHDEMISMIQAQKEGKTIQWNDGAVKGLWISVGDKNLWAYGDVQFRVAPEDIVRYAESRINVFYMGIETFQRPTSDIKLTFDGVTKKLKSVEMI